MKLIPKIFCSVVLESSLQKSAEEEGESYTRLVDEQGNMNIAVAEGNGYRVYRLNKAIQNRELYKCLDCELLRKTRRDPVSHFLIHITK